MFEKYSIRKPTVLPYVFVVILSLIIVYNTLFPYLYRSRTVNAISSYLIIRLTMLGECSRYFKWLTMNSSILWGRCISLDATWLEQYQLWTSWYNDYWYFLLSHTNYQFKYVEWQYIWHFKQENFIFLHRPCNCVFWSSFLSKRYKS